MNPPRQPARAVFLDRDGVLNWAIIKAGLPFGPSTLEEFEIFPESADAVLALKQAGFKTLVVTNQPDVARGLLTRELVEDMHRVLKQNVAVDEIRVCFHTDEDGCDCRKPKPGMLVEAAREWGVSLFQSFMVGDRWRDVDAGKAACCRTIFIDRGYAEPLGKRPDYVVSCLTEALEIIVNRSSRTRIGAIS